MKHRFWIILALVAAAFHAATASEALLNGLQPQGFVSDYAGSFEEAARTNLESYLQDVKRQTGAEIAVVTLKSLDGGEINDFANRLFAKWGIGQKGEDNGILLLAAVEDRKVRIEVGYGLEGALPDAKTGRILDEEVIPLFKENRYAEGLTHGAVAIALIVAQEAGVTLTAPPPAQISMSLTGAPPAAASTDTGIPAGGIGALVFVGVFLVIIFLIAIFGKKSKGGSSGSSSRPRSSSSGGGSRGGSSGGFSGGSSGGGGASRSW
ncbi:MAG: TPM domain-containing protein [Verrucomicrobia bacterium]|nr:TPM domain-containing protein [Verrucomicrobiota bacterium]